MRKLILSSLLLSFASYGDVMVLDNGDISTSACAYGRGQAAITQAQNSAAAELSRFIKGNKTLEFGDDSESFESSLAQVYSNSRDTILEGLNSGRMQFTIGQPYLQGSDTCLVVAVNVKKSLSSSNTPDSLEWQDDSSTVTVTVIGEGWSKAGDSARQRAEQDALRRAISRVVGIYLSQNSVQSSQTIMQISNNEEHNALRDLMSQQMSSRSAGLVKSWQPLASKKLSKDGLQVTLQVVVEKSPLIAQSNDFLDQIGSPRVKVIADDNFEPILKTWLSEQGIETGSGASLQVIAKHKLRGPANSKRLSLTIEVRDLANNLYGKWDNDPSLVALPDSEHLLDDLTRVTFEMPEQLKTLQQAMSKAFINVVSQGGLVREIKIRSSYLSQPEKLHAVISTIGGVKDVAIFTKNKYLVASLRYPGDTRELALILQNSLAAISTPSFPNGQVIDDQTILFN
ncbi:hypothetical protein [Colwellia hornerae]|uniref:Uncharacterized protein n=1 Tax=Colwellia hornerae TaxID=89402 RepID=A0A5C6QU59_9GAMM|nr:hypothetical protein [Colwellia hornerae]TWX56859.1 hypothetical protein ESZ28_03650 [Colwellia hornerae]TWX62416.1 hypothetical protein ESZ26_03240 [Colwellia hornerae]TWX72252.1 hypothetical protein ESZ27_00125 [Colwellia hornerae]